MDNMMRCYIILYNVITEGCDSLRCDLVCYQVTAECHKGERGTLKAPLFVGWLRNNPPRPWEMQYPCSQNYTDPMVGGSQQ